MLPPRRLLLLLCLILITGHSAAAGLEDADEFKAARQALADGLPGVAAVKAERLLKRKGWSKTETRELATFAAEAWARAHQPTQVLALAEAYDLADESFWRAGAHALTGDLQAAHKVLSEDDDAQRKPRAMLLLAQVLAALDENEASRAELDRLVTVDDPFFRSQALLLRQEIDLREGRRPTIPAEASSEGRGEYLRACTQLQAGEAEAARRTLDSILATPGGGLRLHHAAMLLQAAVLMQEEKPAAARDHLIKFLDETDTSDLWKEGFALLDQARQTDAPSPLPEAVLRWIASGNAAQQAPEPPTALREATMVFRGHTLLLASQWLAAEGKNAEAAGLLEALLQLTPEHPIAREAMSLAMDLHAALGANERVLLLAEKWRGQYGESSSRFDFVLGKIQYAKGDHWHALESFQKAASVATSLAERRRGLYNAATAAILTGDFGLYNTLLGQLAVVSGPEKGPGSNDESAATLKLEKALFEASQRKAAAEASLRDFLTKHPDHPRFPDACIALAEWYLLASPPRAEDARRTLEALSDLTLTDALRQRIAFTQLWLCDADGDPKGLLAAADDYLKSWPRGLFAPEARLKIASTHYRAEDFANARTEFEIIARDYPDTPHANTALYFAALCASSVMSEEGRLRATAIWDELAAQGGAMAIAARRQQAVSQRQQGDHASALATLEKILTVRPLDDEQRRMTLCDKAEVLLVLGRTDAAHLATGVALMEAFLAEASLSLAWKARAGFTLASLHHEAGRDTEALEVCYDVLRTAEITPAVPPVDYAWLAKAGFFGIDLLESARQWEPAARLAEQIARQPGDRAPEARERATKIRLEHFLWDGPTPTPPKVMTLDGAEVSDEKPDSKRAKKSSR